MTLYLGRIIMSAPIGYTCRNINRAIGMLNSIEIALEDLRADNETLRSWGDSLETIIVDKDDEISSLRLELIQAEYEIARLMDLIDEIENGD